QVEVVGASALFGLHHDGRFLLEAVSGRDAVSLEGHLVLTDRHTVDRIGSVLVDLGPDELPVVQVEDDPAGGERLAVQHDLPRYLAVGGNPRGSAQHEQTRGGRGDENESRQEHHLLLQGLPGWVPRLSSSAHTASASHSAGTSRPSLNWSGSITS